MIFLKGFVSGLIVVFLISLLSFGVFAAPSVGVGASASGSVVLVDNEPSLANSFQAFTLTTSTKVADFDASYNWFSSPVGGSSLWNAGATLKTVPFAPRVEAVVVPSTVFVEGRATGLKFNLAGFALTGTPVVRSVKTDGEWVTSVDGSLALTRSFKKLTASVGVNTLSARDSFVLGTTDVLTAGLTFAGAGTSTLNVSANRTLEVEPRTWFGFAVKFNPLF